MFCEKCGKLNQDGAVVCEVCGTPLQKQETAGFVPSDLEGTPSSPVMAFGETMKDKFNSSPLATPENKKKLIMFGSILAGALIIIIILCMVLCGGNGRGEYADVVEDYYSSMEDGDIDTLISLAPEFYSDYVKSDSSQYTLAEKTMEMQSDLIESVTYAIEETEEYDEKKLERFVEELNETRAKISPESEPIVVAACVKVKVSKAIEYSNSGQLQGMGAMMNAAQGAKQSETLYIYKDANDDNWYLYNLLRGF